MIDLPDILVFGVAGALMIGVGMLVYFTVT